MKAKASSSGGNPRGRGTYNAACDVCARKKTKCDGNKPVCEPCRQQGRQQECAWTKTPMRKPRTEQHFESMHKRAEALQMRVVEWRKYADYLESLLEQLQHASNHYPTDYRAARPVDNDSLQSQPQDIFELEFDPNHMGSDDVDASSDPGDPTKELCNPTQSLKHEGDGLVHYYGNTAPFRFDHLERPPPTQPSRFPALAQNPDATYILITDGTPDSHYNPDFDWSRHLPSIVPLKRKSHDKALDLLFKFFTSWCLRVVPALFLRDMYRALSIPPSYPTPPKTPHYSPMLHNALIALGLAFLDDPELRDLKSRQYFANKAKSYIETECAKPNLSVVNALSVLASFHSSQGDQTLGYLYFGMSARMSQAWLNVDCAEWVNSGVMDESDLLDRRWTYWTTFAQDVCWSLYVGRDFCVSTPTNTELFKAVSSPLVDLDFDQMPWVHQEARLEPQPNYLTKTFEATCELLMIARRIMDVVNNLDRSRNRPFAMDDLICEIDLELNTWKGRLSPELDITVKSRPTATPHKLMLHLAYWWLFILLHRPFFQRKNRPNQIADRKIDHVKLCRRAAENIMELLATWRDLYSLRYCPITLIQTVFSAGTIYLLSAMQASSGYRVAQKELRHSMDQQALVLKYLNEIGKSWQCATNISGIMKSLMEEQLKPLLERKTIPITTSTGGALFIPEYANDDNDDSASALASSKDRALRHVSLTRHKPHRLGVHSRAHSVNHSSQPSPSSPPISLSPSITISHAQPDSSTYATSSPARSSPIAIRSTVRRDSFSSTSPSSFPDSWAFQPGNVASSTSGSPSRSVPSSNLYVAINLPGSASSQTSFVHRDLRNYTGLTYPYAAQPPAPLDELSFVGSGHTSSHMFQGRSALFDIPQDLTNSLPPPSQYTEMSGYLGMPGGQTLPQAPSVIGLNFDSLTLSSDVNFSFDSQQPPFSTEFLTYDGAPTSFEEMPAATDNDANMDDSTTWESWRRQTFDS